MRSKHVLRASITLFALAALGATGLARGADHTPLATAPAKFVYPSGANIAQQTEAPADTAAPLAVVGTAPGTVQPSAALGALYAHPSAQRLTRGQIVFLPKSQARIALRPQGQGLAATDEALYRFGYYLQYKDVRFWKYSTHSQVIRVKGNSRKVVFVRGRNLPDPNTLGDTTPTVRAEDATALALEDARKDAPGMNLALDQENGAPQKEIQVGRNRQAQLAWAFVVRSNDRAKPFARHYWVAARDQARILSKEDMIYHADGTVTGTFYGLAKSPLDPPDVNKPLADYTAATTTTGDAIVTAADGTFTLTPGAMLNTRLSGPFCRIINEAGAPIAPQQNGNNLFFSPGQGDELGFAQVSAFRWVNQAHRFVKDVLDRNPSSGTDHLAGLPTHVNLDQTCNAFFDPSEHTLNFFKAGDGCQNSAYCDVVCHEFGHAVDDQFGGILDGGYSEGFGDSVSVLIKRTSVIGKDFQGQGQNLRDAADVVPMPSDPENTEVHQLGRTYAGFTWELTRQLLKKFNNDEDKAFAAAKDLVLGAAAMNPKDIPDAVRLSFFIDHQNGSPFFDQLKAAADSRQIPTPDSPDDLRNTAVLDVARSGNHR